MAQQIILPQGDRTEALLRLSVYLNALPADKPWRIDVSEYRRRRSDEQNRYLWKLYAMILEQGGEDLGGWTKDDLHEFFLGSHFGWETLQGFGKKRLKPMRRSSRLNVQEFSDLVAFIQQFMAERAVYLPDPESMV